MARSFQLKIGYSPCSESLRNFCDVGWNFCGTVKLEEKKNPEMAVNTVTVSPLTHISASACESV